MPPGWHGRWSDGAPSHRVTCGPSMSAPDEVRKCRGHADHRKRSEASRAPGGPKSSSAWAWADGLVRVAGQHPAEISTTRFAARRAPVGLGTRVRPASSTLRHRSGDRRERGHLGQVGDHQHLAMAPQTSRQGPGQRERGGVPPTPASTSSNTIVDGPGAGQTKTHGQHGAGQLPAGGRLGQRAQPSPALAPSRRSPGRPARTLRR
jgi:hypothetical protein